MKNQIVIEKKTFQEERALFQSDSVKIDECIFLSGESPLKESKNLEIIDSTFVWKYPLWYGSNIKVMHSIWKETARAGVWYTKNISVRDSYIEAPKNFRRCDQVVLCDVVFPNAKETLWNCKNITLENVKITGEYFGMNCENIEAKNLDIEGDYSFDGAKNVVVHNSKFISKDAFWNSENITIYDSYISGEYFGWNSKNLTLINCTVESLQGMCFIENLVLKNCRLPHTTLAFEYSSVDAEIVDSVESILNPASGKIRAKEIKELILQKDKINPSKTKIVCEKIDAYLDEPHF